MTHPPPDPRLPGRQATEPGPKRLAKSSGEQVRIVRAILEGLGLEIATPDEARAILSLKGADRVAF